MKFRCDSLQKGWKKTIIFFIFVFLLLFPGLSRAKGVTVVLKPGYFSPLDTAFREIYGAGIVYGGEASLVVWKNLDLLLTGRRFARKGELTFTKDETKVNITRIGWAVRYRLQAGKFQPYAGLGLNYTAFKETNFIGEVKTARSGLSATVGSLYTLTSRLIIDLSIEYSSCRISPTAMEVDIGGWCGALGLGYRFGSVFFSSSK